jgi:Cation transport ATPase
MLARLGLAWLAMMQVMMFAFPGYVRHEGMAPDNLELLDQAIFLMNWISLLITVPVILYCAQPVWYGAFRRLAQGQISMDVPVAMGIVVAFIPSAWSTWAGKGEVYFDSVAMFVAFLLTARYLELCARQTVEAGGANAQLEAFRTSASARANRAAFWFVSIQVILALVAGAVWWFYIDRSHAVPVMVAMFVMSCPCAMAMAVPSTVSAAHAAAIASGPLNESEITSLVETARRVTRQNLYGSVVWHLLMTPLAAVGLVAPWVAAITMLLSSLAVAGNAWLLYRRWVNRAGAHAWPEAAAQV